MKDTPKYHAIPIAPVYDEVSGAVRYDWLPAVPCPKCGMVLFHGENHTDEDCHTYKIMGEVADGLMKWKPDA